MCQQLRAPIGCVGFVCLRTCRAFVVPAVVFHTWCPRVDFSRAPVFVFLTALELTSAFDFDVTSLARRVRDCVVTDVATTITAITSAVGSGATVSTC